MRHSDATAIGRRRVLRSMGGVGAAALAGTGTGIARERDGDDDTNARQGSVQGQPVDAEFTVQLGITNPNLNFNEFNFARYSWTLTNMLMDPLAQYNAKTDQWVPVLAKDWTIEGGQLTMDVDEGYHWHTTGEPVTARDAARSFWLELQMDWSVSEYATDIRARDKWTVVFDLKEQLNRNVLEHELLGGTWVNKPPHVYGKWIDRFENAGSEEEKKQIRKELSQWSIDEPFGYGPAKVTNMTTQGMTLEPFEGHPRGEAMNFDTYAFEYVGGGNNKVWQAMRANTVDAVPSVFAPKQVVQALPDNWLMTLHPSYGGYGVGFNHSNPDLEKRTLRQALAHAIDREQVANNAGSVVFTPLDVPDGLAPQVTDQWFGDWQSNLSTYPYDPKRAAQLMRDAGYRKQGPYWRGPSGPLEFTFVAPAGWSDWVTASQTINSQLRAFGVNSKLSTIEASTYNSQTLPSGRWDLAAYGWGGGPYPLFSYQQLFEEEDYENLNYSRTPTVPKRNGSGTTTVDVEKVTGRVNQNASAAKQGFRTLSWVWNQDLPMLPVLAEQTQSFITTDDWQIPPKDADVMAYSPPSTYLPKFGELQAETR